jgi:hypothetical protein
MPSNCIPAAVIISLAVAYVGSARADDPPKQSDAEIRKLLIGRWSEEMTLPNGAKGKATTTYKDDGTFAGEATFELQGQTRRIALSGTWKVEGGTLIETIDKCEPPVAPKGTVSKDAVLSISKTTLRRKTKEGKVVEQKRVGD